jgi:hypothetical protein
MSHQMALRKSSALLRAMEVAMKPFIRGPKFRLGTLFLLIGALSIVFASSKIWRDGADKQRSIIRELTRHGWKVEYPPKLSAAEKATRGLLPRDYFACPYKASVGNRSLVSQRDIDLVGNLSGLEAGPARTLGKLG